MVSYGELPDELLDEIPAGILGVLVFILGSQSILSKLPNSQYSCIHSWFPVNPAEIPILSLQVPAGLPGEYG